MKLIGYDKGTRTSTITLTDDELVDLSMLVGGVLNIDPDYTALEVPEDRVKEIKEDFRNLIRLASGRKNTTL